MVDEISLITKRVDNSMLCMINGQSKRLLQLQLLTIEVTPEVQSSFLISPISISVVGLHFTFLEKVIPSQLYELVLYFLQI